MVPFNQVKEVGRKMFLSLDYKTVHHRKQLIDRLDASEEQIEWFNLPSCRPKLDYEEQLNTGLKQAAGATEPVSAKTKLPIIR